MGSMAWENMKNNETRTQNHRYRWSPEEIDYLETHHLLLSIDDIAERLVRTARAVQAMSYKLGLERKQPRWTDVEIQRLKKHYRPGADISALCLLFPGRTRAAVLSMVDESGLPRPEPLWRDDELRTLKHYYPAEGTGVAARLTGRSRSSVRIQASKHGIVFQGNSRRRPWSMEEKHLLARNIHLALAELISMFPARSKASVTCARRRIKLKS